MIAEEGLDPRHKDYSSSALAPEQCSTDLTPAALATLDRQARWLGRYPTYTFVLEGHADERGTREDNSSLSARRAQTFATT